MSLSDPGPPHMPPPPQHYSDSAAYWSQFPMSNDQFDPNSRFDSSSQLDHPQPPLKRPRNFDENPSSAAPYPRPNPSTNRGATNIFFKTRMCAKFKMGSCRNGENCNFAHGTEDMRQPPPNWQELVGAREDDHRSSDNWDDDQKIIHKMKLCKKFYNGEECPYGDRCNFLHEGPSKFRDDSGRFRETSAICIGTSGLPMGQGNGNNQSEVGRAASSGLDPRVTTKTVYWKTKLCTKFEVTGHCPFGDKCHFAHGAAGISSCSGFCYLVFELLYLGVLVPVGCHLIQISRSFFLFELLWTCNDIGPWHFWIAYLSDSLLYLLLYCRVYSCRLPVLGIYAIGRHEIVLTGSRMEKLSAENIHCSLLRPFTWLLSYLP